MVLEHDSNKIVYRIPHGAAETDSVVRLRIAVASASIPDKVTCIVSGNEVPMYYSFDIGGGRVYECLVRLPDEPGLVFYYFYAEADGEAKYYGNNSLSLGGTGLMYECVPDRLFQITVYAQGFKTPDWMKNAVIYQIFPDRFNRTADTPFHGIRREWCDEPFWNNEQFGGKYLSNDFFGGNLAGIEEKLGYLADMGVTVIYLNPIFKSFSNHRYDTSDYETIDETLGTNEDFERLAKKAKEYGIRIILDGVFSHTGADSRYFNKYGNFNSVGAYQSKNSPYYSWYSFTDFPNKYESWWGFDTLPNVNELDESYTDYIAEKKDSVIKSWIEKGASGWRLDVADELPDDFIYILRKSLKEKYPDAVLLGEVWEDASNKVSYGEQRKFLWGQWLDTVMNYVFRDAVLDYLVNCDAAMFSMRIKSMHENYPKQSLYSAMNLISSHDVPRALTVLSGAPDFRSMDRFAQHEYVITPEMKLLAEKRMLLAVVIQMTMPGAPCIYYGDEACMYGYADPFNRAAFPWGSENCPMREHIKKLAQLRNSNACLRTGYYNTIYYFNGVISYMRSIEGNTDVFGSKCENGSIITVINSSDSEEILSLDLDRFGVSEIRDVFTDEKYEYNHKITLTLPPFSYKVLELERNGGKCIKIQHTQQK